MANPEHLAILKQGAEVWNRWRRSHSAIQPDLRGADLRGISLSTARLDRADLSFADMTKADLSRSDLSGADLKRTNLYDANLKRANLYDADLHGAGLSRANLYDANLIGVHLSRAGLSETDLTHAKMYRTVLNDLDLRQVKGMATVQHLGPSYIDIQTIYLSHGEIPEVFLRGAGVPDSFIEYMRFLVDKPIDYYSCFISYSSKDQEFAKRLYADLQHNRVRCWFAPEDLKIGDKFWDRIEESIRLHDKLLVILSEHSVESDWVEDEVMRALEKERQQPGSTVLFPIRLDEAVQKTNHAWASSIRMKRHIGDFSRWKDHDAYQRAFERLVRDLKAAAAPNTPT